MPASRATLAPRPVNFPNLTTKQSKNPRLLKKGHEALQDAAYAKHNSVWSAFQGVDVDHDGKIDGNELMKILSREGVNLDSDEIQLLKGMYDTTGDGKINLEEYRAALQTEMKLEYNDKLLKRRQPNELERLRDNPPRPKSRPQHVLNAEATHVFDAIRKEVLELTGGGMGQIRQQFEFFDPNKTGMMSQTDVTQALHNWGVECKDAKLNIIYRCLDPNNTGVDYNEFLKILRGGGGYDKDNVAQADHLLKENVRTKYQNLRKAFNEADQDNSGFLDINELDDAIKKSGAVLTDKELHVLMDMYDGSKDGKIDAQEFMAAIDNFTNSTPRSGKPAPRRGDHLDGDQALKQKYEGQVYDIEALKKTFAEHDKDGSGYLSMEELRAAVEAAGVKLDDEHLQLLLEMYDKSRDGKVHQAEFIRAIKGQTQAINPNKNKGRKVNVAKVRYTRDQLLKMVREKLEASTTAGGMQARKEFKQLDRDGSGQITKEEFNQWLSNLGVKLQEAEFEAFFDSLDEDGSGTVKYNEFLKNVLDMGTTSIQVGSTRGNAEKAEETLKKKLSTKFETLTDAFRAMDQNRDGKLTLTELRQAVNIAGMSLTGSELRKLMALLSGKDAKAAEGKTDLFATYNQFAVRMGQDADALRGGKKSVPGMELHAGAMSKYAMGAHTTETTNQKHHARHAAFSHMVGDPTKQFEGMPDNFRYSYGGLIALLRKEFEKNTKVKKDLFERVETNAEGKIECREFSDLLRTWGYNLPDRDFKDFYDKIDADNNGLDKNEFLEVVLDHGATAAASDLLKGTMQEADRALRQKIPERYKTLRDGFRSLDGEKKGFLDLEDLRHAVNSSGVSAPDSELRKLLEKYDVDGDGKVNFRDWEQALKNDFYSQDGEGKSITSLIYSHNKQGEHGVHDRMAADKFKYSYANLMKLIRYRFKDIKPEEKEQLFKELDTDGSGSIDDGEFQALLRKWGYRLKLSDVHDFFGKIDTDGSGELDYDEFLAHVWDEGATARDEDMHKGTAEQALKALTEKYYQQSSSLRKVFLQHDLSRDDFINLDELRHMADHVGVSLGPVELMKLMNVFDHNGDNKIDYPEFQATFAGEFYGDGKSGGVAEAVADHGSRSQWRHERTEFVYSYKALLAALRADLTHGALGAVEKRQKFNLLDGSLGNHDGFVQASEVGDLIRSFGYNLTSAQVADFFSHVDTDHSGTLSLSEFMALVDGKLTPEAEATTAGGNGSERGQQSGTTSTAAPGGASSPSAPQAWSEQQPSSSSSPSRSPMRPPGSSPSAGRRRDGRGGSGGGGGGRTRGGRTLREASPSYGHGQGYGYGAEQGVEEQQDGYDYGEAAMGTGTAREGYEEDLADYELGEAAALGYAERLRREAQEESTLVKRVEYELLGHMGRSWQRLLTIFRKEDSSNPKTGFLDKGRFRRGLNEFGMRMGKREFEVLWRAHAMPSRQGLQPEVNYREFLQHFVVTLKMNESAATSPSAMRSGHVGGAMSLRPEYDEPRTSGFAQQYQYEERQQQHGQQGLLSFPQPAPSSREYRRVQAESQRQQQGRKQARGNGRQQQRTGRRMRGERTKPTTFLSGNNPTGNQARGAWQSSNKALVTRTAQAQGVSQLPPALKRQIATKWKSIRKTCEQIDTRRTKHVEARDMLAVLTAFGVEVTVDDMLKLPGRGRAGPSRAIPYNDLVRECLRR